MKMILSRVTINVALTLMSAVMQQASAAEVATCTKTIEHYRVAETGAGGHSLENPASYCLTQDLFVKWNYSWIEGRYQHSSKSVIEINESNVKLDLKKHEIWSKGYLIAAVSSGSDSNERRASSLVRNIEIKNGEITVKEAGDGIVIVGLGGDQGYDVASDHYERSNLRSGKSIRDPVDPFFIELAEHSIKKEYEKSITRSAKDYPDRSIRIKDLKIKIKGGGLAIVVQGAGTIIKNNVIEVDGGTAIWLGGPGAIIEGNTIIVSGHKDVVSADAAIRLKHGDGAVIRNNRFIIKNGANKRLISTFDTGDFRFEQNDISGLGKDDPIAHAFSGELRMHSDSESSSRRLR